MEYTIYNETLIYYALRNSKTNDYYCEKISYKTGGLLNATMFGSLSEIQDLQEKNPQFDEIRMVKVIDIGGIE